MEKYAFLLMVLLSFALALSAIKQGSFVTKARWIQGLITIGSFVLISLWFVLQSENNLESSSIITKNAEQISKTIDKTFIFGTSEERNHLSVIKFSIFTSLNFLLLFLNVVLMIRNVKLERNVIT